MDTNGYKLNMTTLRFFNLREVSGCLMVLRIHCMNIMVSPTEKKNKQKAGSQRDSTVPKILAFHTVDLV